MRLDVRSGGQGLAHADHFRPHDRQTAPLRVATVLDVKRPLNVSRPVKNRVATIVLPIPASRSEGMPLRRETANVIEVRHPGPALRRS